MSRIRTSLRLTGPTRVGLSECCRDRHAAATHVVSGSVRRQSEPPPGPGSHAAHSPDTLPDAHYLGIRAHPLHRRPHRGEGVYHTWTCYPERHLLRFAKRRERSRPIRAFRGNTSDYEAPTQRRDVPAAIQPPCIAVRGASHTTRLSSPALGLNRVGVRSAYASPHLRTEPSIGRGCLLGRPRRNACSGIVCVRVRRRLHRTPRSPSCVHFRFGDFEDQDRLHFGNHAAKSDLITYQAHIAQK